MSLRFSGPQECHEPGVCAVNCNSSLRLQREIHWVGNVLSVSRYWLPANVVPSLFHLLHHRKAGTAEINDTRLTVSLTMKPS